MPPIPISRGRLGQSFEIPRLVEFAYSARMSDVSHILEAIERGEPQAAEELLPLVYDELRRLAAHKIARERPGHTLQPTALVHEAWLRLAGEQKPGWAG